jgi:C4-dicarboxylate-specific signal transduction histidine kinase
MRAIRHFHFSIFAFAAISFAVIGLIFVWISYVVFGEIIGEQVAVFSISMLALIFIVRSHLENSIANPLRTIGLAMNHGLEVEKGKLIEYSSADEFAVAINYYNSLIELSLNSQNIINGIHDSDLAAQDQIIKLEQVLTQLQNAKLGNAAKTTLANMGEMAAGVAHEINNPLAVLYGHADLLRRILKGELVNPQAVPGLMKKMEDTTLRIARILNGMETFAQDSNIGVSETVSVIDVVKEVISDHQNLLDSVKLYIDYSPSINCKITGSRDRLYQVFSNLITNSADAISKLEQQWIKIEFKELSSGLQISWIDSGGGIDHEIVKKMMNPFYTTKPVGKGTGLGLSIVQGIVEKHNGIFYFDENSENTKFVIVFRSSVIEDEISK